MVIPGNTTYDYEYYSLKLNSDHLGVPVSLYVENLIGKILRGQDSGNKVRVDNFALPEDSEDITDLTLFVKYLESGDNNIVEFAFSNTPFDEVTAVPASVILTNASCPPTSDTLNEVNGVNVPQSKEWAASSPIVDAVIVPTVLTNFNCAILLSYC